MQQQTGAPLPLFYSYAYEDEPLREQLEKHLRLLARQRLISEWHNRQIGAGEERARQIDEHLEAASIILLLISPDFLASDYCYSVEMQRALERHKRGEAHVIPIFLRPVDWEVAPFANLQGLPRDGKSITEWENQDAAFRDVVQNIRRAIVQPASSAHLIPRLSSVARQKRLRLLKQVRAIWIKGVLEQSLHHAALIALGLQEQPNALANPWHLEVQETNRDPHPLPAGTSIIEVYDEADGELLILGEPGAGKTTLLLKLTQTLLERAEQEERHRMPIVFNLSSWTHQRPQPQPFADWLVEELSNKYQVPPKISLDWIKTDQIIPLLDGLDEVTKDDRAACAQAINSYQQHRLLEQGTVPLVICCRSQEYIALPTRVTLPQAVSIQPLTDKQMESYIQSAKGQLEGMRHALRHDRELYELAQRPLMLSILTLAYQGVTSDMLPRKSARKVLQHQAFATYVERMLTRRGVPRTGKKHQVIQWLIFLARNMSREGAFYKNELSEYWLPSESVKVWYHFSMMIVIVLLTGLDIELTVKMVGPIVELAYVLLLGLSLASAKLRRGSGSSGLLSPNQRRSRGHAVLMIIISMIFVMLVAGLFIGPLIGVGILSSVLTTGLILLLQPFMLRFWLWRANCLPWNIAAFLDEVTDRLLLRKVGGGYIFIHRLLLDYFVDLEEKSPYADESDK